MSMKALFKPLMLSAALAVGAAVPMALVGPGTAAAQDISRLGEYRDWRAFTYDEDGNRVCYMASEPTKDEGDYTRRGDIYAMVTHRPAQGTSNVVSFVIGYTFQEDSRVTVQIDGQEFTLFTHNDTAWAPDAQTDSALVDAMREGRDMVVRGTSSRGTDTTDTYSLLGFTRAHNEINETCDM